MRLKWKLYPLQREGGEQYVQNDDDDGKDVFAFLPPSFSFPVDIVLLFPPPRAGNDAGRQAACLPGSEKLFPEEAEGAERAREESFSGAKVEKNGRLVFVFAAQWSGWGGEGGAGGTLTKKQAYKRGPCGWSFPYHLLGSLAQADVLLPPRKAY